MLVLEDQDVERPFIAFLDPPNQLRISRLSGHNSRPRSLPAPVDRLPDRPAAEQKVLWLLRDSCRICQIVIGLSEPLDEAPDGIKEVLIYHYIRAWPEDAPGHPSAAILAASRLLPCRTGFGTLTPPPQHLQPAPIIGFDSAL